MSHPQNDAGSEPLEAPFAGLSPDALLDALEAAGWRCDGRLLALNSYENRVYQVWLDGGQAVVAKFYRPGRWSDAAIEEEHAFLAGLGAAELPVVTPLAGIDGRTLQHHDGFRFAVFPRQGGRAPELESADTRMWMGRLLARIHQVGRSATFAARPAIDVESFGTSSLELLRRIEVVPEELRSAYFSVAEHALENVRDCYVHAGDVASLRLHGDCHPGNVLWTDAGPHFVDFDDARSGPAVQDLWMLVSGTPQEMARQFDDVIDGYQTFLEFDARELHLVEALRTLRLIHHSAWIASRWHDPAFPTAFPWFASPRYWQDRVLELREQIAAMQEAELVRLLG